MSSIASRDVPSHPATRAKGVLTRSTSANMREWPLGQPRSLQTLSSSSSQLLRPPTLKRQKSLNLSTETFHRSRISFLSEMRPSTPATTTTTTPSDRGRLYPSGDAAPSAARTPDVMLHSPPLPQYHSCSSIHTRGAVMAHRKEPQPSACRCYIAAPCAGEARRAPNPTAEGLSWRRLHMSRAKLKATSTTSELLSGFAMVAMVELQINEPTNVPEWLFVMFAVCTTVLVSVHIFALMISTYILPNIDAISKLDVCELVAESPHERMRHFIEIAWAFSTVLGLFLFLVEVGILCWVKFWDYSFKAAIAATIIVIPVLVIFILFAVHFYRSLLVYRCDTSEGDLRQLEEIKRNLDKQTTYAVGLRMV